MTTHPNFTTDAEGHMMSNDFVLLKLERPSQFEPVQLAVADGSDIKAGEWATVSGWGRTDENATTSYELQHVKLQLKTKEECVKALKIDDTVTCAGGPGNSPCAGDSGGPLVKSSTKGDDVLIGLVSWGDTCGRDGTPTAFAIVSRVRGWIGSIVGELA
ncbi:Serine protease [Phytophthora megakarya]|uniref:Serine protease n=1 Tax=Phytophthora megakarya TaxID=4795 RepID=A0A225WJE8_9STRA|nr:Serine protease [Phytophthora megakarya]